MLPTWGDKWNLKWGQGPEIFTPGNAESFGKFLGERYKDYNNIIWVLGGDRAIEEDIHKEITRALARGLRQGDRGRHLITFHPQGGQGSAQYFHEEDWLDFNMRQTSHTLIFPGRYDQVLVDYNREPIKPVLDAEPIYEDHPIEFKDRMWLPGGIIHVTVRQKRLENIAAPVPGPLFTLIRERILTGYWYWMTHQETTPLQVPADRTINYETITMTTAEYNIECIEDPIVW